MTTQLTQAAHAVADVLVSEYTFKVEDGKATECTNIKGAFATVNSWYAINKKKDTDDEAEISIYDAIGGFGVGAKQFVADLKKVKASRINLRINSPGGEITEATTIYNAIKEHPARVTAYIDGIAASAGSFIAMSGAEVRIADNGYMMIHEARAGVYGESEDLQRYANLLETMNDQIAGMYEKKSGKPRSHWREMMKAETWYAGAEAVEAGLADSVYEAGEKKDAAQVRADFDFKVYNCSKIPAPVKAAWGIADNQPSQTPINNSPATEGAARAAPTSAATPIQETHMADNSTVTTVAPAQTPAAGNKANTQDNNITDIEALRKMTNEGYRKQGHDQGLIDGDKRAVDRLRAILTACPGEAQMAMDAFLSGQTPESAKLTYEAVAKTRAASDALIREKENEIARWRALDANGGYSGGVPMAMADGPDGSDAEAKAKGVSPREQAEWEWNFKMKPDERNRFNSKDIFLNFREMQLTGQTRI